MAKRVAAGLRLGSGVEPAATTVPARREIKPSPALSIIGKDPHTLKGRVIGLLVSDGAIVLDRSLACGSQKGGRQAQNRRSACRVPRRDNVLEADQHGHHDFDGAVMYRRGRRRIKAIGHVPAAKPLLRRAGIVDEVMDVGIVRLTGADTVAGFIDIAKKTRVWDREPKVRNLP